MANAKTAAKLRALARQIELGEVMYVTTGAINDAALKARLVDIGSDNAYGGGLCFDDSEGYDRDARVMFLCFAAAMAETGDL